MLGVSGKREMKATDKFKCCEYHINTRVIKKMGATITLMWKMTAKVEEGLLLNIFQVRFRAMNSPVWSLILDMFTLNLCVREYTFIIIPTGPRVCWNEFNLGAPGGNKSIQQRSLSFTHSRARALFNALRKSARWMATTAHVGYVQMLRRRQCEAGGVLRRYAARRRSSNSNGRAITQNCPRHSTHRRRRQQRALEMQHWGGNKYTPVTD
jgi:hypothetical protein